MKIVNKKNTYILFLFVICLLAIVIVPTYAKFIKEYTTSSDVAELRLNFLVDITDIEEYEQINVPAGETYKFNVKITNNNVDDAIYYGIWYRMVNPGEKNDNILIGRLKGTDVTTSGSIDASGDTVASIGVINNTAADIIIDIGVSSSSTSVSGIEYLGGRRLVSGELEIIDPKDLMITSIKIDNVESSSLPTSGLYNMTYTCSKGSQLEWDTYSKSITYKSGSYIKDKCSLEFTTSTDYKYLNEMAVGSYVAYEGKGGTVGTSSVACKKNGDASSGNEDFETEAPNSCLGQNAREDLDSSGYTYGYCYSADNKYYTTGWRIAYIDKANNKAVIVSAGSPECNTRTDSTANAIYIQTANALALKYCNSDYVDGNCTCTGSSGKCTSPSTDAWAINDNDFYNITKAISGVGKRLTIQSSSLGDSGGKLGSTLYCMTEYSYQECGYNNTLIDNGGYYWFASQYSSSFTNGVGWNPGLRHVASYAYTYAYGLRPVISLSSSVSVTGGKGTIDDPYTISK